MQRWQVRSIHYPDLSPFVGARLGLVYKVKKLIRSPDIPLAPQNSRNIQRTPKTTQDWLIIGQTRLLQIKDSTKAWKSANTKNHHCDVFCMGHYCIAHGYLMNGNDPQVCPTHSGHITDEHVFLPCPKSSWLRLQHWC